MLDGGEVEVVAGVGEQAPEAFARDFQASCPRCLHFKTQADLARGWGRYWQVMHQRAVERESALKEKLEEIEAKLCERERQLFGEKTERSSGTERQKEQAEKNEACSKRRKRGQQRGKPGHGRRRPQGNLPAVVEDYDLAPDKRRCAICQNPFEPFPGTEDSEIIEVEVRAHRRVIRRKRYRPTCSCPAGPGIVAAPGPPRLMAKTGLGVSVWVKILLDKFLFQRPTHRLLADLRWTLGLKIAQGTITGGLKKLAVLFEPLIKELVAKNLSEHHWHADETGWRVFCEWEGKRGYHWQLWVFQSPSSVVFRVEPTRAADVPIDHFGQTASGILSVDRYVVYKVVAKNGRIVLAFCWAHLRRDYIRLARDWGGRYEGWALQWVRRIGEIYRLNDRRLAVRDDPSAFAEREAELRRALEKMVEVREAELNDPTLGRPCAKALRSMRNHWEGFVVFVDHPDVPMDNNTAERAQRDPVVGRKNYYGSGAYWSAVLAATMFSLFQTLKLWKLNPQLWLSWYLESCAHNGGKAPADISGFLPWNLSEEQRCWLGGSAARPDSS